MEEVGMATEGQEDRAVSVTLEISNLYSEQDLKLLRAKTDYIGLYCISAFFIILCPIMLTNEYLLSE